MTKYFRIICLFVLFHTNIYSQTEKLEFEHITRENGLSEGSDYCILQDRKGFLWIGTADGLNRYDGYEFKIFRNIPGDSNSISNSQVLSILEDRAGTLWIGTDGGGLNKFNRDKENFTRYMHNPNDSTSLSNNAVWSIYEDRAGTIWIGTFAGGINKLDRNKNKFIRYIYNPEDPGSLSFNTVISFCEDSKGNLWIGTLGGGLNKLSMAERNNINPDFIHFRHDPNDSRSLSSDRVTRILEDKNGIIWVGTLGEGLDQLNWIDEKEKQASFLHYKYKADDPASIGGNEIVQIYEDRDGQVWIGTWGGGLNKLIPGKDKNSPTSFKTFTHDANDPRSLSGNIVYTIYEDNSGLLWVGSWAKGFNKFNKKKKLFKHYKHVPNSPSSLSVNSVLDIYEDRSGILWIGTFDGGLNRFDRKTEKFKHYRNNANDPFSIGDDGIYSIFEDKSGMLWIGTFNGGLNMLNPKTENFTRYQHNPGNPKSISSNFVNNICEDKDGNLWIGTFGAGLNRFDRITGEFTHYRHIQDNSKSLSGDNIELLYLDKSGELWIGTHSGLNRYDRKNDNFTRHHYDPNNPSSLSNNYVFCIHEDKKGRFWIGTNGGGLNKYDTETGKFFNYRMSNGLPNDVIYGILEGDNGNLWLSTNDGLSKFNPDAETFRNYDERDGLQSKGFNSYSYCKSRTGELLFGGPNGLNIFHPDSIKDNEHIPSVVLTNFLLYNEPVAIGFDSAYNRTILKKSITEADQIELSYEDKVLSFEFSALDFHVPWKNKYAYIMEGFENDWNYTDANRRFASYTNLDPGEYTFRVKGSNNDGIWNEAGTSIKVIILPPWWSTSWAYIIYSVSIISIIYLTWKLQLKRIRIKHDYEMSRFEAEKMHEVDEMKNRFFANISHEFRTPLTLISGPAEDLIDETENYRIKEKAEIIKRNAARLNILVNQLLDISKLEAGKMKLETTELDIIPIIKGLVLSFASFAERKNISLKFSSPETHLNVFIDREKITKIITNLLSNALKFTHHGGMVEVSIEKLPDRVKIDVMDNGIGIPASRMDRIFDRFFQVDGGHTRENEGTGIGLALTKELVELHKGRIMVDSREDCGSTFTVTLPLGKHHYSEDEICGPKAKLHEITLEENTCLEVDDNETVKKNMTILLETGKPLILVVEDNPDVRKYIIDHLEKEFRIIEAADGDSGLHEAVKHFPDLIISDIMMPKMDGLEFCKKVKEDERTSHIPVILLTAKAADQDKLGGFQSGADDYIMKPFDTKLLKARIRNLIENRRRLQEKFHSEGYIIPKEFNSLDEVFLKRILNVIDEHISDENFNIEMLSKESAMSREQIYKKLVALTGKSPVLFLRSIRLAKSRIMLKERRGTISEISYLVGFSSPAYFTKCFKEEFGYSPSELLPK